MKVELFQINLYTIRSQILEFQNVLSLSIFAVHKEALSRDVHDDGLPCHHNQSAQLDLRMGSSRPRYIKYHYTEV